MIKPRSTQATRLFVLLLLALTFTGLAVSASAAQSALATTSPQTVFLSEQSVARLGVYLGAASGGTISFQTQNGYTVEDLPSQTLELPHLVLYRNGALTPADERTLIVELTGIDAPAPGVTVTLEIETQHTDPGLGGETGPRISVWRMSQWIASSSDVARTGATARFVHEFGATVASGTESIATPTDYFRYEVTVTGVGHPAANPLHTLSREYAFLMENQWVARLPEVRETSPGAAPDELIVYYCDMVPFRKDRNDPATWLPREDVTAYVGTELLPRMVEAFRVQTDEWSFPWTPAWTSFRPEVAGRLSVALSDGRTWFHDWAPGRGHAGISINVSRGAETAAYESLTDGLVSNFHHELFHNLQRNLSLNLGGDGRVGGAENTWRFFSEGTATLASSVGQPGIQYAPSRQMRTYMRYANRLVLWDAGFQDLIASDQESDPYSAALYWRFLYEQCGGMAEGIEDLAAGMQIIRRTLTALYAGEVVDISSSVDLAAATPKLMDRALAGSSCPFQTYQESLTAFARAIYALRLEGGRCREPGTPTGCGFYDPHDLYRNPYLTTIPYAGAAREHRHEIASGAAMAFVDVLIDPTTDGQSLAVEFSLPPEVGAGFHVQVLRLLDSSADAGLRGSLVQVVAEDSVREIGPDGRLVYALPEIRTAVSNRLGLIITHLDGKEPSNSVSECTVSLHPGVDPVSEAAGYPVSDLRP